MNLSGLFEPTIIFQDEELPGIFALGIRNRDEFIATMLDMLAAPGVKLLDGLEEYTREELAEDASFKAGEFVLTSLANDAGTDWFVQSTPIGDEALALSEPFEATMAVLPS